ncbi:DEAD/DEAH box helicase [Roseobacter ponti]|uniref:DEAD/DEAH box helicase n=1 Tax=Roseobacter ponti TaxID=1891787 RepID=A0A858SRS0_9RHOB|nr:DEAD/DEAH box helicase [Roseobacter ponti]QJF50687.1 DEAD/DEAH box helicase [Roseobacter ponti]
MTSATSALASPGSLIRARGREWIVLPGSGPDRLLLRPLSGMEGDATVVLPALEQVPPEPAIFEAPDASRMGTSSDARLLSDALRLSLRRGAGPFRSSGRIAFEPRSYQLVPLIMALRLDTMRLLIADDVGIGKTIEAGLILREMWDRGEVTRACVLCPPHLVEQWVDELREKFDLHATAVTATTAPRLERGLALNESPFDAHPLTVVSLDYIKADRRRTDFAKSCPNFVIVDEAHASVGGGRGKTQRQALLDGLAKDPDRHMVLLTATPHSGDAEAFDDILALLRPDFSQGGLSRAREELAQHFVQRRRIDVREEGWEVPGAKRTFPKHDVGKRAFKLTPSHLAFHEAVLAWCTERAAKAGHDARRRRLAIWATLALMRCVGSSPAAAVATLEARRALTEDIDLEAAIFDENEGQLSDDDLEPGAMAEDTSGFDDLLRTARDLEARPQEDAKLSLLKRELTELCSKGHQTVIFCRYIATAEAVGAALRNDKTFKDRTIEVVTGRLPGQERRVRVESMSESERRILVATDCLSEGINLQTLFNAVVHYDLSWNPTRHQQREGRVDRFGQPAEQVRSLTIFGSNSAIDGAVLDVILRKAEAIRKATNVSVSMLDDRGTVSEALMHALVLKSGSASGRQGDLFRDLDPTADLERLWRDAEENEKASRARFAQRRLKPEEVIPEWQRVRDLLGDTEDVRRFVRRALDRVGITFDGKSIPVDALPDMVREALSSRGIQGRTRVSFDPVARPGIEVLHRTHPIVATLSDILSEGALEDTPDALARSGAWVSRNATMMRTLALLRVRHRIRRASAASDDFLLAEEIVPVLWEGTARELAAIGVDALKVLDEEVGATLPEPVRRAQVLRARDRIDASDALTAIARSRAETLIADHDRLRVASSTRGRTIVEPVLPPDLIALHVILPEAD